MQLEMRSRKTSCSPRLSSLPLLPPLFAHAAATRSWLSGWLWRGWAGFCNGGARAQVHVHVRHLAFERLCTAPRAHRAPTPWQVHGHAICAAVPRASASTERVKGRGRTQSLMMRRKQARRSSRRSNTRRARHTSVSRHVCPCSTRTTCSRPRRAPPHLIPAPHAPPPCPTYPRSALSSHLSSTPSSISSLLLDVLRVLALAPAFC